jgi:hypothetical protein
LYNTYSLKGHDSNIPNGNALKQIQEDYDKNRLFDPRSKQMTRQMDLIDGRPMFDVQLAYKEPEESSNVILSNQEISLLTGEPINKMHNNMVPFFGSNIKQNIETFSNESLLDLHTGKTAVFKHKKEVANMFDNVQENIYGAPLFTNLVDTDRYIPSVYRQNEKGVDDIKVSAPISGTIDNNIRPEYKDVNDLRVLSNPKETYDGRTLSGQMGEVRGIQSEVHKRRPETFYEKTKDHLFVTTGDVIAPKTEEDYSTNFKDTSRQDYNLEYYGTVKGDVIKDKQRVRSIDNSEELEAALFQAPKRQNFKNDYLRNIGNITSAKDYGKDAMNAYETERTTTGLKSHLLNATKQEFGVRAYLQDAPKDTLKQTTITFDNSGNVKTTYGRGNSDPYNIGISDITLKTTHKETAIINNYKGNPNKMEGMGYIVTKYQPRETHKEETLIVDRASGPQNFQIASGKDSFAELKYTENMKIKESVDSREKMNVLESQIIPDKRFIGYLTKYDLDNEKEDTVSNDRLQPDLVQSQLNQNPYSIYNQKKE